MALSKGVKVNVRMNTSWSNKNQYNELKQYFKTKGFYDYNTFDFYCAMITDNNNIDDINRKDIKLMSPEDYSKIVKEKVDLFKLDDNTLYHNISDAIVKKKPLHFRSVTCASQTNGYVLDPLGHIYPCWEVVGNPKHLEGQYTKLGVTWNESVLSSGRI